MVWRAASGFSTRRNHTPRACRGGLSSLFWAPIRPGNRPFSTPIWATDCSSPATRRLMTSLPWSVSAMKTVSVSYLAWRSTLTHDSRFIRSVVPLKRRHPVKGDASMPTYNSKPVPARGCAPRFSLTPQASMPMPSAPQRCASPITSSTWLISC